ncbi:MAG: EAL domain-containing protein [Sulfurimonas sp.]
MGGGGGGGPLEDSYTYYTKQISLLIEEFVKLLDSTQNIELRGCLQNYLYLLGAKESAGKMRALLLKSFLLKELKAEDVALLLEIKGSFFTQMNRFKHSKFFHKYKHILNDESFNESIKIATDVLNEKKDVALEGMALKWFEKSTYTLNSIKVVEDGMLDEMRGLLLAQKVSHKRYIATGIAFLVFFGLVLLYGVFTLIKSILHSTSKLNSSLNNSRVLLEQYKGVMDQSMIVSKTDTLGFITYVNDQFCKISGYTRDELIGKNHNIIRDKNNKKEIYKELWYTIKGLKRAWQGELKNRKKDGGSFVVKVFISPILDEHGEVLEYIGVQSDITSLVEQKELFEQVAKTDHLTGHGNRYKLLEDIKKGKNLALALFNIDNFRELNDFYGHSFGDSVIAEVVCVAHCLVQDDDKLNLYRLKGDEIAILARDFDRDEFVELCEEMMFHLKKRHFIDQKEVSLSWSCGISFEPKDELLTSVDMALKLAKQKREDVVIYTHENSLKEQYHKNLQCVESIREALVDGRFETFYQSIVNNQTLEHEKYESLVRMVDSNGAVITPYHFLDVAKKSKNYFEITKIVITQAFERFASSKKEFSINLSVEDILSEDIRAFILRMLLKYDIGKRVVFELVESEYVGNFEAVSEFISEVKKYGCKIAIDDFGTGYSNFEYIIKLKADYLKIDGSLIKDIAKDKSTYDVVLTIVRFAKSLGLKTIAEFVEDEQIYRLVKEMGVEYSQGYYFAKPSSKIEE